MFFVNPKPLFLVILYPQYQRVCHIAREIQPFFVADKQLALPRIVVGQQLLKYVLYFCNECIEVVLNTENNQISSNKHGLVGCHILFVRLVIGY